MDVGSTSSLNDLRQKISAYYYQPMQKWEIFDQLDALSLTCSQHFHFLIQTFKTYIHIESIHTVVSDLSDWSLDRLGLFQLIKKAVMILLSLIATAFFMKYALVLGALFLLVNLTIAFVWVSALVAKPLFKIAYHVSEWNHSHWINASSDCHFEIADKILDREISRCRELLSESRDQPINHQIQLYFELQTILGSKSQEYLSRKIEKEIAEWIPAWYLEYALEAGQKLDQLMAEHHQYLLDALQHSAQHSIKSKNWEEFFQQYHSIHEFFDFQENIIKSLDLFEKTKHSHQITVEKFRDVFMTKISEWSFDHSSDQRISQVWPSDRLPLIQKILNFLKEEALQENENSSDTERWLKLLKNMLVGSQCSQMLRDLPITKYWNQQFSDWIQTQKWLVDESRYPIRENQDDELSLISYEISDEKNLEMQLNPEKISLPQLRKMGFEKCYQIAAQLNPPHSSYLSALLTLFPENISDPFSWLENFKLQKNQPLQNRLLFIQTWIAHPERQWDSYLEMMLEAFFLENVFFDQNEIDESLKNLWDNLFQMLKELKMSNKSHLMKMMTIALRHPRREERKKRFEFLKKDLIDADEASFLIDVYLYEHVGITQNQMGRLKIKELEAVYAKVKDLFNQKKMIFEKSWMQFFDLIDDWIRFSSQSWIVKGSQIFVPNSLEEFEKQHVSLQDQVIPVLKGALVLPMIFSGVPEALVFGASKAAGLIVDVGQKVTGTLKYTHNKKQYQLEVTQHHCTPRYLEIYQNIIRVVHQNYDIWLKDDLPAEQVMKKIDELVDSVQKEMSGARGRYESGWLMQSTDIPIAKFSQYEAHLLRYDVLQKVSFQLLWQDITRTYVELNEYMTQVLPPEDSIKGQIEKSLFFSDQIKLYHVMKIDERVQDLKKILS